MFSHAFSSEMACCEESVPQLLVGELALAQGRWVTFLLAFYVQFFLQFSSKTHRWVWAQPSTSPQPTFSPHLDLLLLLLASPCWRQILILTTKIKINLYERFQGFQGNYFWPQNCSPVWPFILCLVIQMVLGRVSKKMSAIFWSFAKPPSDPSNTWCAMCIPIVIKYVRALILGDLQTFLEYVCTIRDVWHCQNWCFLEKVKTSFESLYKI